MGAAAQLDRRDRLSHWWQVRTRAERMAGFVGAGFATVAIAWLIVWLPLQRDIDRLTRELAGQRAALASARQQVDTMAGLERMPPAPARDARASVDAALARSGHKASAIDRSADDRLRVTVDAIPFDALAGLLEAMQRDAALHAVDLTAAARVEPGMVRADFTLAR